MALDLEPTPIPAARSNIKSKVKAAIKAKWLKTCTLGDFYSTVNPDKKAFKPPTVDRRHQTQISKLRHNSLKLCPHRCQNLCAYCSAPFSTGHYLISCPVTRPKADDLRSLLTPEEHAWSEDQQAARILCKLAKTPHHQLLELLKKKPPDKYCPTHPRQLDNASRPWWSI